MGNGPRLAYTPPERDRLNRAKGTCQQLGALVYSSAEAIRERRAGGRGSPAAYTLSAI
jgi:hypothetical protein